jgi:regulator of replication initiation timing
MDQEQALTLKDIALQLDLPESTLRKYRDAYPEFIPTVGTGRDRRYTPAAAEVFAAIRKCRAEDHISWEDTAEYLAQKFPLDTDAGKRRDAEPALSVAERVPAAVQTANTLKSMEAQGAEHSFLLTTIGAELVRLARGVDRMAKSMDDLAVLRRTVLSQDNQIRNMTRMVAASLEDMQAWREERAELLRQAADSQPPQPQERPEPMPDRDTGDERRRDLYAVLDRLVQLQSTMAYVVKQFERKSLDFEKMQERLAAAPAAPAAPPPDPEAAERDERRKQEAARLRALIKERDEEIQQLQAANRRLRIESDALKSRVAELSRIEPAAPAAAQTPLATGVIDTDKMSGGKLFFRGTKK